MITYRQLRDQLDTLSQEQLDCNVSVYLDGYDEFFPVKSMQEATSETDVLDENHPFLFVK